MHQTYRSAIGKGILFILILGFGVISALLFFLLDDYSWAGLVPLGLLIVYLLFLYTNIRYHLSGNRLKIDAGFKQKDIDIFQISSLRPLSSNFNFSNLFALSENRLRVVYGYGNHVDIAPRDQEQFIDALLTINPMIQHHPPEPSPK